MNEYNLPLEQLTDIGIDDDGNFLISSDGDFQLIKGNECVLQDIKHELMTYAGNLFYDEDYGGKLIKFINKPNDEINRIELIQSIEEIVSKNEKVESDTVECEIIEWDLKQIVISVSFYIDDKKQVLFAEVGENINVKVVSS